MIGGLFELSLIPRKEGRHIIEGKDITKKYGNKVVLKGIDLTIPQGQFVTVLGPNGAGKSTLMKILSLLLKPSTGKIMINDVEDKDNTLDLRKQIGVLSHNSFLYDNLTTYENLWFYGNLYDVSGLKERINEVIEEVGLQYFINDPVRTFSRGMVQRLAIARAIIHDPQILFLDEPYTGLDQHAIQILNKVLAKINMNKRTIFMITHNFEQGLELSDRILIVNKGKIAYDSPVQGLTSQTFKDIYLRHVEVTP